MNPATGAFGAVVLAGGRSRRMGADKALLDFCGRRMIDVVVERLRELTDAVIVATKRRHDLGPDVGRIVEDEEPYAGPLAPLIAGIRATGADRVLAVGCDMPFLSAALLRDLVGRLEPEIDAVVPLTENGPQPLHAAYGACAVEPLLASIAAGERSLRHALDRLRVRWVTESEWRALDPDGRSFLNINTPGQLRDAVALQMTQ